MSGIAPTFNLEVKCEGEEDGRQFLEGELKPFLEDEFSEVIECRDTNDFGDRLEVVTEGGGKASNIEVRYRSEPDTSVGNLGKWPAIIIYYSPHYSAEMPYVKQQMDVLDEIRDFLIKRKPASDVKYYSSARDF